MPNRHVPQGPQRIVCLTEEPTVIFYRLGEGHRVVGISAYTVRPPEARRDTPVVSAFVHGHLDKIRALVAPRHIVMHAVTVLETPNVARLDAP